MYQQRENEYTCVVKPFLTIPSHIAFAILPPPIKPTLHLIVLLFESIFINNKLYGCLVFLLTELYYPYINYFIFSQRGYVVRHKRQTQTTTDNTHTNCIKLSMVQVFEFEISFHYRRITKIIKELGTISLLLRKTNMVNIRHINKLTTLVDN